MKEQKFFTKRNFLFQIAALTLGSLVFASERLKIFLSLVEKSDGKMGRVSNTVSEFSHLNREQLAALITKDYRENRTKEVDGWVLSQTEIQIVMKESDRVKCD